MELDPSKVCQVCYEEAPEGKSFQYHYGALCCLSCRAFFRRIVQLNGTEGIEDRYDCVSKVPGQKCNMKDFGYTHRCFKCRMERCLEVGIKPEKVLLNPTQRTKYTGKNKRKDKKPPKSDPKPPTVVVSNPEPNQELSQVSQNVDFIETVTSQTPKPIGETFDQMLFQVSQSVSMDFFETVGRNYVPMNHKLKMLNFFEPNQIMTNDLLSKIVELLRSTLKEFLSKNAFFGSLSIDDQALLVHENLGLLVQFCIVKYQAAQSGFDQYSWLTLSNPTEIELDTIELKQDPIKNLFMDSSFGDDKLMEIYAEHCQKVEEYLNDGLMSHPGLIILTTMFDIETWNNDVLGLLTEKKKITNIYNLCVSAMNQDGEINDVNVTKLKLQLAKKQFQEMNSLFPTHSQGGDVLQVLKQPVTNDKESLNHWLGEQFSMIDQATYGIQPTDIIYGVAAKQYDIMLGKCDDSFIAIFLKSIGSTFMKRSMQVLCNQNGGLAKISKSADFQKTLTLSLALQTLQINAYGSMQEALNYFFGNPLEEDLGIDKRLPPCRWSYVNDKLHLLTDEETRAFARYSGNICQFIQNPINGKILYLLALTSVSDYASGVRLHTAILSSLFHLKSDYHTSETEILGPFMEKLWELNQCHDIGKKMLNLFF